jgi:hypothetical protein
LRCIPLGLASHARSLQKLYVHDVQYLKSLENLAAIVELEVYDNPDLMRNVNLPKLWKLDISGCQRLKVLEGLSALQKLELTDNDMETLPIYLKDVNPTYLQIDCTLLLLTSIAAAKLSHEWDKFSHIQQVKAYANDGDIERKWCVLYTRDKLETNVVDRFQNT